MVNFSLDTPFLRVKDQKFLLRRDFESIPSTLHVFPEELPGSVVCTVAKEVFARFAEGVESAEFVCCEARWRFQRLERSAGWTDSAATYVHSIYTMDRCPLYEVRKIEGWVWASKVFSPEVEVARSFLDEISGPFDDPYTRLAAFSLQNVETHYTHWRPAEECSLLSEKGEVSLSRSEEPSQKSVLRYCAFMERYWGKSRVAEIAHRYGIDFLRQERVTPELVYRMNIGTLLWDTVHLEELYQMMRRDSFALPLAFRRKAPVLQDVRAGGIRGLSAAQLQELMEFVELGPLTFDRAQTGRALHSLKSYSTVMGTEFKPWVDEQELAKAYQLLKENDSWEFFYEICAHVLCKREMSRKMEQGYRAGIVFPAPHEEGELREWYEVTWLVCNPQGLQTILLEPLWRDSKLPRIIVDRSTSSHSSTMYAKESILNDFNALSAPGGAGHALSAEYLNPILDQHTLPLWVAYALAAEGDAAEEMLRKATKAFAKEKARPKKKKGLRELIRSGYDVLLNDLFFLGAAGSWMLKSTFSIYGTLRQHISAKGEPLQNEEELTKQLLEQLDKTAEGVQDEELLGRIARFKEDLRCHVLAEEEPTDAVQKGIPRALEEYMNAEAPDLIRWRELLLNEARSLGEHPAQKKASSLHFVGHSLGAACGQAHMARQFAERRRLPFAGSRVEGWFFDDPAINEEQSRRFMCFVLKQRAFLKKLRIVFALNRRQEKGDIVPLGGEEHLGATYCEEERDAFEEVVEVDYRLRAPAPNTQCPEIAFSRAAHETQYSYGEEGDYREEPYSSQRQGEFDSRGAVITHYDPEKGKYLRETRGLLAATEIWRQVTAQWRLPSIHMYVEGEWVRTSECVSLLVQRLLPQGTENRITSLTDGKGLYVVSNAGVVSKTVG